MKKLSVETKSLKALKLNRRHFFNVYLCIGSVYEHPSKKSRTYWAAFKAMQRLEAYLIEVGAIK